MKDEPLYSDQIINHYTGCDDTNPPYCRPRKLTGWRVEPEYLKPVVSPDFWHGVIYALLLCIPFWATLIGIVWLANIYLGGG